MAPASPSAPHREGSTGRARVPWVLAVGALTLLGGLIRLRLAHESLLADELSTQWIVTRHGLGGVLSTVHSDAEITPPLFFVLSWVAAQVHVSPELLRAPSLIAGVGAIPLAYLIGTRAFGRRAGLIGSALVALSPFMAFYSSEARGYALMVALVMLALFALLRAADGGGARWWALYGACSCGAMYTHYTAGFALAAMLAWALLALPGVRRPALLANVGAVVGFLPWTTGFLNDLRSPTTKILSGLEPFTARHVRVSLEHWAVGHPYAFPNTGLGAVPGVPALCLMAAGVVLAVAAWAYGRRRERLPRPRLDALATPGGLVLLVALAVPIGEAVASAVGTNVLGVRNLAVGWPMAALCAAAVLAAPRARVALIAAVLVVAGFAIGVGRMLEPRFARADYASAARLIDQQARPGDVVIDRAVISPGPITPLEAELERPQRIFRAGRPQENTHPFGTYDPTLPLEEVNRRAVAAAGGRRIFILALRPTGQVPAAITNPGGLPPRYRRVEQRVYPGIVTLVLSVWESSPSPRG